MRLLIAGACTIALAACAGDRTPVSGTYSPVKAVGQGQDLLNTEVPATYRLGVNDIIQVKVYGEPELSFERIAIAQNGTINMPFLGDIAASGQTAAEFAQRVRTALGKHLVNPQVSVNLVEYGSQRVTVEGAVVHPGVFELVPGSTLLSALATAGDPSRVGKTNEVIIIRTDSEGRSLAVFNVHDVRAGRMIDPVLKGGDRVIVGSSGSTQTYLDIIGIAPLLGIFTRF